MTTRQQTKPAILITAGPTREYIDNVRFISNASSGKMGLALLKESLKQKLPVTIITSIPNIFNHIRGAKVVSIKSADEMLITAKQLIKNHDIFISAAAVADYKPTEIIVGRKKILLSQNPHKPFKLKKDSNSILLKLKKTPDILNSISRLSDAQKKPYVIVGFALEKKQNLISDARRKLKTKYCDFIVANQLSSMESDKSIGAIVYPDGKIHKFRNISKKLLASKIIKDALKIWQQKNR